MTPKEFKSAIEAFVPKLGERGKVYVSIHYGVEGALEAGVYTNWPMGDPCFRAHADTFSDLFPLICDRWEAYKDAHRTKTIRKLALEIIRITAEFGECTDAHLRGVYSFSAKDVTELGTLACADANAIAGNGPFSIVANGGANAHGLENVTRDEAGSLQ